MATTIPVTHLFQGHDSSNYNGIIICIEDSVDHDQLTDLDQYCFQTLIY